MTSDERKSTSGIFVVEGTSISIPEFRISLGESGQLSIDPVALQTKIDVCPLWLEIAFDHLLNCGVAAELIESENNDSEIGRALKEEFFEGMQCVVALGIALDAFYSSVLPYAKIDEKTARSWSKNKTARYKQVSETLRRSFNLDQTTEEKVRRILKEVTRFRDLAIHPDQSPKPPMQHPELGKVVDWRFVYYRHHNAHAIYRSGLALLVQLFEREITADLLKANGSLIEAVNTLKTRYEKKYGSILPATDG